MAIQPTPTGQTTLANDAGMGAQRMQSALGPNAKGKDTSRVNFGPPENPNLTNSGGGGGSGSGPGTGGSGGGGGGGGNNLPPQPAAPLKQTVPPISQLYPGQASIRPGYGMANLGQAQGSFSQANPTGQTPAPPLPGIGFANQNAGSNLNASPFVNAAEANFNQTVLPQLQNQFNSMGLGRSSAAGNAMALAQANMLPQFYNEAAQLNQNQINNQIQNAQFDTTGQANAAALAQQGQQNLFSDLLGLQGQQNAQTQSGAGQLFGMGQVAQQTGQSALTNAYQDFLRQQGLSEAAVNPFGGISGLLGTVTTGK